MTLEEYKRFYIDFVVTILGPAVKREAHNDLRLQADLGRQAEYENIKNGLVILALVSLVESNFLSKAQMKSLRNFAACTPALPSNINPTHLSCFVYLRDWVAHNPSAQLLPAGTNTTSFLAAIGSGAFSWASVAGTKLQVGDPHELHLIVLRFFGQAV